MSYSGNTIDDVRAALMCGNTVKDGSGTELRLLLDSDGRLYTINESGLDPVSALQMTADGQVKASAGTLFGFVIAFVGVTIGDKVEIKDNGAGGTVIFTIICATANETHILNIPQGVEFTTDIYHDETLAGGGAINATYMYN